MFLKEDVERVVKCVPNGERAKELLNDAYSKMIPLFLENGDKLAIYTTQEIRDQELKLIRLGGYINRQKNLIKPDSVKEDLSLSEHCCNRKRLCR